MFKKIVLIFLMITVTSYLCGSYIYADEENRRPVNKIPYHLKQLPKPNLEQMEKSDSENPFEGPLFSGETLNDYEQMVGCKKATENFMDNHYKGNDNGCFDSDHALLPGMISISDDDLEQLQMAVAGWTFYYNEKAGCIVEHDVCDGEYVKEFSCNDGKITSQKLKCSGIGTCSMGHCSEPLKIQIKPPSDND